MTDDLKDDVRADRLINEWRQDGIWVDESHTRQLTEHFRRVRENERDNLQPGDVLPNGWVAPDELTKYMLSKLTWEERDFLDLQHKFQAMRAAAIREREG